MCISAVNCRPALLLVYWCVRDALKEGWWQFTVEGSLWVPLPHLANLLSLSGIDRYGNSDVLYREVQQYGRISSGMSLLNSIKGAGWVLPDYSK